MPQTRNPYVFKKLMKKRIANNATIKATTFPIKSSFVSSVVKPPYSFTCFKSLYPVAASMVGTAKKKENSAARLRVSFCCIPPIIEAALRLMPGISARHCHRPMKKDCLRVICFSEPVSYTHLDVYKRQL